MNLLLNRKRYIGDKYDYSKVDYINAHTKVCIICPEHGEFLISPSNHIRERGCPKCKSRKKIIKKYDIKKNKSIIKHTTKSFIIKSKEIHR